MEEQELIAPHPPLRQFSFEIDQMRHVLPRDVPYGKGHKTEGSSPSKQYKVYYLATIIEVPKGQEATTSFVKQRVEGLLDCMGGIVQFKHKFVQTYKYCLENYKQSGMVDLIDTKSELLSAIKEARLILKEIDTLDEILTDRDIKSMLGDLCPETMLWSNHPGLKKIAWKKTKTSK